MVEINLLPWRKQLRRKQTIRIYCIYAVSMLSMLLFVFGYHVYSAKKTQACYIKTIALEKQLTHTAKPETSITDDKALHAYVFTYQVLNQLFHMYEKEINIKKITQENERIIIQGETLSLEYVRHFMVDLLSKDNVHAVKLISVKRAARNLLFQVEIMEQE